MRQCISPSLGGYWDESFAKRQEVIRRFQTDESIPFFVLSVKAGGTGLNLTTASHIIHYDRWWNPAVENQATDRAFRIGQTKNVLVHKFVCWGTVEDKIAQMIDSKQLLAGDFLSGGAEVFKFEGEISAIRDLLGFSDYRHQSVDFGRPRQRSSSR